MCILLKRYCQLSTNEFITVCIARGAREIKSIAEIQLSNLTQIVQATFSCGIFTACNVQWKQREGTSIGNQISPLLSALPVIATEIGWLTLCSSPRLQPFLPIRYVDNRFIMYAFSQRKVPALQTLFSTWFYGSPIELEDIGTQEVLGFLVSPSDRTIHGKSDIHTVLDRRDYYFLALDLEFV